MAPSLEENLRLWQSHDWGQQGDEWSRPWGGPRQQWLETVYPRIQARLPAGTILEIGSGGGRWTQYLKNYCEKLIGVDLAAVCVEKTRLRFSSDDHVSFHLGDGLTLPMIADESVDLIFSFDSLVHADSAVIESYAREFSRILAPNGAGFIHHSNLGQYEKPENSHCRATDVSAASFAEVCRASGLFCFGQEKVSWGQEGYFNDCFSSFARGSSGVARVMENPHFAWEPVVARMRGEVYGA